MSVGYIEGENNFLSTPVFLLKIVRCKVKGKQLRFQAALQTKFFKIERRITMNIMHYDYSDKTTVPTELLQDPYLSVDTKGLAAILCSFGKEAFELSELNKLLKDNISDERIFRTLMELYDMCYLDVWEEGDNRHLMLRGM